VRKLPINIVQFERARCKVLRAAFENTKKARLKDIENYRITLK